VIDVIYNATSGRIATVLSSTKGVARQQIGDDQAAVRLDPTYRAEVDVRRLAHTHYVDPETETLVARPPLAFDTTEIAADKVDAATLTGLPDPCEVRINREDYTVTGGTLTLRADLPGSYRVEISDRDAFPAQAVEATITVTEPESTT
jgi:hypothetical protein